MTPGIGCRGTDVPAGVGSERCEGEGGGWKNRQPTTTPRGPDPAGRNRRAHRPPPDPRAKIAQSTLVLGLDVAAREGALECVRLLLEAGADPVRTNNSGESPLDAALDHMKSWENIVASGPDEEEEDAEDEALRQEMNEYLGVDSEADAAEEREEKAKRHAMTLAEAKQVVELIRQHEQKCRG